MVLLTCKIKKGKGAVIKMVCKQTIIDTGERITGKLYFGHNSKAY